MDFNHLLKNYVPLSQLHNDVSGWVKHFLYPQIVNIFVEVLFFNNI